MIEIKLALEEDLHLMKKTFKSHDFMLESDFYMVIKDGDRILGYSNGVIPHEELAIITNLYILPTERGMGLGDGLLRSTFNSLALKGSKWILIKGREELKDFLIQEELIPMEQAPIPEELIHIIEEWKIDLQQNKYFYCEPNEFFSRKCKGNK